MVSKEGLLKKAREEQELAKKELARLKAEFNRLGFDKLEVELRELEEQKNVLIDQQSKPLDEAFNLVYGSRDDWNAGAINPKFYSLLEKLGVDVERQLKDCEDMGYPLKVRVEYFKRAQNEVYSVLKQKIEATPEYIKLEEQIHDLFLKREQKRGVTFQKMQQDIEMAKDSVRWFDQRILKLESDPSYIKQLGKNLAEQARNKAQMEKINVEIAKARKALEEFLGLKGENDG